MKRLAAPKSWMLDKLGGVYAVRPSSGPHRLRECMPVSIFLRNRLKYALTRKEVRQIFLKLWKDSIKSLQGFFCQLCPLKMSVNEKSFVLKGLDSKVKLTFCGRFNV